MLGIVVVTHGRLAPALLSTLSMILGETQGVKAVSLSSKDSLETLQNRILKALDSVDPKGTGAFILVDMLGGTPFNCAMQIAVNRRIQVLTGVNLPMLFKVISHRDEGGLEKLARQVQQSARESILVSGDLLKPSSPRDGSGPA
jgi:PTS system mannose-specific IIA component